MKKPEVVAEVQGSDLEGLPGIGAVRRAALAVAGITTRAELGRATIEQLISITGIQRAYAVKVLDLTRPASVTSSVPLDAPTDEGMPGGEGVAELIGGTDPSVIEAEPPFDIDLSIFKATTALADASRRYQDSSALLREFVRFAKLLARLPGVTSRISRKRKSRISTRLDKIAVRLEKSGTRAGKTTKKFVGELCEALKTNRHRILEIVAAKAGSNSKGKK